MLAAFGWVLAAASAVRKAARRITALPRSRSGGRLPSSRRARSRGLRGTGELTEFDQHFGRIDFPNP